MAYRRLDAPGVEELIGCGVAYGSAPAQAPSHTGEDVVLVGDASSAGQAALHLAGYARSVTMVARAASLDAGMSRYLVDRVTAHPRLTVRTASCVTRASGRPRPDTVTVADRDGAEEDLHAHAMYVLIGGALAGGVVDVAQVGASASAAAQAATAAGLATGEQEPSAASHSVP